MKLQPVRRSNLSEEILEQLSGLILSGEIPPGSRLPPERDLAKQLKVGRSSLREALRMLALMGLIEVRSGEGTFVPEDGARGVVGRLSWAALIGQQEMVDLIEARKIIEGELAALAARNALPGDIEELEVLVDQMEAEKQLGEPPVVEALQFHLKVAEAAHNSVLHEFMKAIRPQLRAWLEATKEREDVVHRAAGEHHDILVAIKSRDPDAARRAMLAHLEDMAIETLPQTATGEPATARRR